MLQMQAPRQSQCISHCAASALIGSNVSVTPQGQNLVPARKAAYPRHKNVHDVEVRQFADVEDVIVLGTANVCPEVALGLGAERAQHHKIHRVPHHQDANGLPLLLEAGQYTALAGGTGGTPHKGARRFVGNLPAAYQEICCGADSFSHCL